MSNVSSSNGLEKRPKLRFPGFAEPWNETNLEDLGNFYNGLSGKDKSDFGKGADCYITYMNVYKNVIADVNGCDVVSIKEGEHQNRVNFGDLLFTQSSETLEEVGLTSVWLNNGTPLLNSFCFGFHFDATSLLNPRFAAYSMRTPYARKRITREGQGATRYNLSSNRLKKVKILYPSHSEQDKIAGLLSLLEARIEKQCEIIDQLKKYKRGLLRDIFSKLNVRYDKRKLKDVAMLFADGDWIESKDQALDGIRLVQTGNVGFGVYLDKPQNAKYISEATFHRLNCLEIYDGDILISRLPEPAGRACLLPQSTERRITAVDCTVIRTDKSVIDRTYLLQFLCSDQYLKTVNSFLAGGTRQRISRKNLEGIEVPYPSSDQQRYYGSFLCKVDARITNAENRLNCLSRLRCFMLQQLFI